MQINSAYGGAYFKNIEQKENKKTGDSEKNLKNSNLSSKDTTGGVTDKADLQLNNYNEQIKLKQAEIANENSKAATSDFDIADFKNMLNNISNQSGAALNAQAGRISQSRVYEVLQNE